MVMLLSVAVSAAPYKTYTYSSDGNILISPDAYVPDLYIDSDYIGLETPFDDPRDLIVGPDNRVYLADAANNRIVVLTSYYKLDYIIDTFVNDQGVPDTFSTPSGVFVNETHIYVCDTNNNRIVIFDTDGNFIKVIEKPESSLFEEGSIYKPIACAVDQFGRIFVISSTTYQGVIVINDNADFFGFIGAQSPSLSAFELFWRQFQTAEQREQTQENTSKELNNITIDEDNFIYVTTSSLKEADQMAQLTSKSSTASPVQKLNASGADVMKRNGYFAPAGEARLNSSSTAKVTGVSTIVDVAVGPVGTWSIIDQKRSKIYTYDDGGNLLFAFGDNGTQLGNIAKVNSITYQDDVMLVLDSSNDAIVSYRRTEYGDLLIKALQDNEDRKYDMASQDWTDIYRRNINYSMAYLQLGKLAARNGEYETAMSYFESVGDTENYSAAFKEIRSQWASTYFFIIPIVLVVFILLVVKLFSYAAQVNKRATLKIGRKSLKEEVLFAFHILFHPFDGFWDLKREKRGSVRSAIVILFFTVVTFFYRSVGQGYIFTGKSNQYMTIIGNVTAVVVPLMLWVISNWCFTTLFEGEGSLKDVFIASCYSLMPLPLLMIPSTVLSNFLILDEGGILSLLNGLAFVWVGLLLFLGMMVTHDYSIGKNILTTLATIVGMAFIMFIIILFSTLMSRIASFISNIAIELSFRA